MCWGAAQRTIVSTDEGITIGPLRSPIHIFSCFFQCNIHVAIHRLKLAYIKWGKKKKKKLATRLSLNQSGSGITSEPL